ncbi:hypothetical protein IGI04_006355 [Brassica rapa subsp. trilocularis]|uniref:Uncharacterized protein n=1 Tax=Brassica rapa subsp. trilocularis TaxID=1813537 RepID=A0ABQ7NG46_BRACM|nr:hypothetical protein IGI04_006158 [Brassica rapa subsp. trilocularis]KAG5410036.1 hypothetical protein IGI04_006355 [Brassica rapa subsp. trilocularis]
MAVKQMRKLNFKKVAFMSPYHRISMLQDIMESSNSYDFSFCYVPRNRVTSVDELAKNVKM